MTITKTMDRRYWEKELLAAEKVAGLGLGYKLLYCPWRTLDHHKMVFLSLNPGAATPCGADPRERTVSDERGNSYEVEELTTRSRISNQFLCMCEFLNVAPAEVLTGVAAPFRSRSWDRLSQEQKKISLGLGRRFWTKVLSSALGEPIVVCSNEATKLVVSIIGAELECSLKSGWGNVRIRRYRTREGRYVVQLPHLSRFGLFGRATSMPHLGKALKHIRT